MKVLMLGWEFPPHISGGLGTACAGLTQALEKEQVDMLFVVPKLYGGEQADGTTFINASAIPIRQKMTISGNINTSHDRLISKEASQESHPYAGASNIRTPETIEVPSLLTPYTLPSEHDTTFDLERWNYSLQPQDHHTLPANLRLKANGNEVSSKQIRSVKAPYNFSGGYGANLLQEVERYADAVTEIARRQTFDIIHAHDWMTYKAGMAAKKISGKPLIVHVHATEVDRSGAVVNHAIFGIEKDGMSYADKVVAVSQWTKNIAIEHYKIAASKIDVVHNGINPKGYTDIRPFTPFSGSRIITFLGRITHQKGPMYFVEAARKVHEQFPDAHFVVAGSGDQLPMMIARIAQLRLSGYFHFTGFLRGEDIDRIWSMSDVYVMPSVSEPFGIAPLEAIQAGVPVILSKQAGVSEVMPHAIKVDFWNCDAFAEAICNVLRFKSLADTLKKNGSEEIKNITWNKAAKKLTTLYHELRSKHEKPGFVLPGSSTKKTAHTAVL